MKAVLTSTGFDNEKIMNIFLRMLDKSPNKAKALFVPAALTLKQQKEYAQCFLDDLLKAGILEGNIDTYKLDDPLNEQNALAYDVMYFSGGDPELLMNKIADVGFEKSIKAFLDNGGIYFGASAGSDIMTNAVKNGLGYLDITLVCHDKVGSGAGKLDTKDNPTVKINDNQAIVIDGDRAYIAE